MLDRTKLVIKRMKLNFYKGKAIQNKNHNHEVEILRKV